MTLSIIVLVFFYGTLLLQIIVTDSSYCCKNNKRTETIKQHAEPVDPQFAVEPVSTAPRKISIEKLTKVKSHLYESILKYLDFDSLETYTYMQVILHYKPKFHLTKTNDDVTFYQYLNFLRESHHSVYQDFTSEAKFKRWAKLCHLSYLPNDSILIPYYHTTQPNLFFDFLWVNMNDQLSFEKVQHYTEDFTYNFRARVLSCQSLSVTVFIPVVILFTFDDHYIPPQIKFVTDLAIYRIRMPLGKRFNNNINYITDLCQHRIGIEVFEGKIIQIRIWVQSIDGHERREYSLTFNDPIVINASEQIYKCSFGYLDTVKHKGDLSQDKYDTKFFSEVKNTKKVCQSYDYLS
jgi:hypothetical protein